VPFVGADRVVLEQLSATRWKLTEPLTYQGKHQRFDIPAGFKTDLASVPRALVWLVPRYGLYTRSAILHDYLLKERPDIDKHDADGIFRRSMRELHVGVLQRWMMWGAVGLNSTIKDRRDELTGKGLLHAFGLLLVVLPSLAFVLIPAVIVQLWLIVFAILEWIAYPINWLLKTPEERATLGKPKLLWKM
jgi:hypothetical protein